MKKTEESSKTFGFALGTIAGFAVCCYLFNEKLERENEDLKKEFEKVKVEADTLRKISIVNINNNTFSPNNDIQQTAVANFNSSQTSPKEELNRWEKVQKSFELLGEAVTGRQQKNGQNH